jgi:hypothetical protein
VTLAAAIRLDEGEHLGWRALWLRGADFALALVPEVGGRIFGLEWRGQQLAFANPDLAVRLTSPVCRESCMQIERRIRAAPGDPCGSRKFGADPSSTRAPATSHWDPLLCSPAVIIGASKSAGETHERRVPASGSTARRRR